MRRLVIAAVLGAALGAQAWAGSAVAIPLDGVRVIAFKRPVATLYVGNPMVADVTMIDNRHAFLQGKAFGATNIVALDARGRQVANQQVVVAGAGAGVVTLQRGATQTTYTCSAARCDATPLPGDGKDSFEAMQDQIAKHQAMLDKAAAGGSQ